MDVCVVGDDALAQAVRQGLTDAGLPTTVAEPGMLPSTNVLVAASGDDALNVELALEARAANPTLPVILRLTEPSLIETCRQAGLHVIDPASAAVPAFLAAVGACGPTPERPQKPVAKAPPDLFLWGSLVTFLVFAEIASIYFFLVEHMTPMDSVYFVTTVLTSVGFGDFSLRESGDGTKLVGIFLMDLGMLLSAVLFSMVTAKLLQRRDAYYSGRLRWRVRDHVIVCGSGTVAIALVEALLAAKERPVVITADEHPYMRQLCAQHRVPLICDDPVLDETLTYANLERARCLLAVTGQDRVNLEIALKARHRHSQLPVVMRSQRPDLATAVSNQFGIQCLSPTALAVPHFVEAVRRLSGTTT